MPQAFGVTEGNSLVLKVETAGELKFALEKVD